MAPTGREALRLISLRLCTENRGSEDFIGWSDEEPVCITLTTEGKTTLSRDLSSYGTELEQRRNLTGRIEDGIRLIDCADADFLEMCVVVETPKVSGDEWCSSTSKMAVVNFGTRVRGSSDSP